MHNVLYSGPIDITGRLGMHTVLCSRPINITGRLGMHTVLYSGPIYITSIFCMHTVLSSGAIGITGSPGILLHTLIYIDSRESTGRPSILRYNYFFLVQLHPQCHPPVITCSFINIHMHGTLIPSHLLYHNAYHIPSYLAYHTCSLLLVLAHCFILGIFKNNVCFINSRLLHSWYILQLLTL